MNERDPFDDLIKDGLSEDQDPIPSFNELWQGARRSEEQIQLGRNRMIKRWLFAGGVSVALLLAALPNWRTGGDVETGYDIHFCAQEAVDDWITMMQSDYFRSFPSDPFLRTD